jgi:acetolactate decarboxylase
METRSETKQKKEYTNLVDVLKDQKIFKFKNVEGVMVGFKFPGYLSSLNAKGFHFHFINNKRDAGGHVLDFKTGKIKIEIERIRDLKMLIPNEKDYDDLNLSGNASASHL